MPSRTRPPVRPAVLPLAAPPDQHPGPRRERRVRAAMPDPGSCVSLVPPIRAFRRGTTNRIGADEIPFHIEPSLQSCVGPASFCNDNGAGDDQAATWNHLIISAIKAPVT